ncbi:hypothetical protein [Methanoculleus chikugoensis]|uniref:hypothetical protein n=1 Tax=Methanoculleus chikugoensis TaxID=118126 RepID=UPI001FB2700D|nr:hypothetical protein [Methanoculleus chikugoensis]
MGRGACRVRTSPPHAPPVTAYLALNFTGSTPPFTSRTGVKREIFRYVPFMAGMAVLGAALAAVLGTAHLLGGAV